MTIKSVGNGQSPYDGIRINREAERPEDGAKSVNNSPLKGDAVSVSEDARLMNVAMDTMRKTPETREDKVARLKAQIQAGTYSPEGKVIAERMVAEELDFWD